MRLLQSLWQHSMRFITYYSLFYFSSYSDFCRLEVVDLQYSLSLKFQLASRLLGPLRRLCGGIIL
jgi:hypothetical protein